MFDAGLKLCLLLFHLLLQTVTKPQHRTPATNATSKQRTAVMAAVAAADRLVSGAEIRIEERKMEQMRSEVKRMNDSASEMDYLCTSAEGQGSTFHLPHKAMFSFPLVETQADTGSVSLSPQHCF